MGVDGELGEMFFHYSLKKQGSELSPPLSSLSIERLLGI
jgi:hypothetical protein